MEFLYYLKDPLAMLAEIQEHWMEPGGVLVAGVDHYLENEDSLDWPVGLSVHMTTLSEEEWRQGMIDAGFVDVETRRVGLKEGFVGTLAMFGRKPATR